MPDNVRDAGGAVGREPAFPLNLPNLSKRSLVVGLPSNKIFQFFQILEALST
jgi:hypothetical protein